MFSDRDRARLVGVHPALIEALGEVFRIMDDSGNQMFVVEGVRTSARQAQLFTQGRSAAGAIVTYKDGVTHRSNHQPHEDGHGYAVDCAFIDGAPFAGSHPWERYGLAAESRGLLWGGRWKFSDLPHVELPAVEGKRA